MLINPDSEVSGTPSAPSTAPAKRRVLIVDDHPIFRHGLSEIIGQEGDLEVCAEAANASAALEAMRELKPDLALLDISLQGSNGIDLLKRMKAEQPRLPVLMVSMHDESLYALRSLRAGASGYVMKREALPQVLNAMRRVLGGEIYVSSEMGERLIFKAIHSLAVGDASPVDPLSDRELEVLQFIGRGFGTREIARQLHLSVKTIESHRAHIKEKLGCKTSGDVVRFAIDWTAQQHG